MASKPDRPTAVRTWTYAAAAAAVSACLFYAGTGLDPVGPLAWLAPLPVLLAATRLPAGTATGAAAVAYLLGTSNSWAYYLESKDVPPPVSLLIVGAGTILFALSTGLFGALVRRRRGLIAAVAFPSLWTAVLFLFTLTAPVGHMGTMMDTQAGSPIVLQIASVTGGWGLEWLVPFVPAAVAAATAPGATTAARIRAGVAAAVPLALVLGFGAIRLGTAGDPGEPRTVAVLVRANAPWGSDPATPAGRAMVEAYAERIAALPTGVDLVVLPEGAFRVDASALTSLTDPLAAAARTAGADVVAGVIVLDGERKYNTATAIPADGGAPVLYRKWHNFGSGAVVSGTRTVTLPGDDRVALVVCRDLNFPDPAMTYAMEGARFMAIPASDEEVNGRQHALAAVMRGVENGMAVAWAGQRGTLLVADAYGHVLAEEVTEDGDGFVLITAALPPGPGATPYSRLGDWFAWLCVITAVGAIVLYVGLRGALRRVRGEPANELVVPSGVAG